MAVFNNGVGSNRRQHKNAVLGVRRQGLLIGLVHVFLFNGGGEFLIEEDLTVLD